MNFDIEEIEVLLAGFVEKHPLAAECGGEYIMQNDKAQVDALQLVCDIFDNMQKARISVSDYHIGCGITGIFAGKLNKKCDVWISKSDVTDEACKAVAQFLIDRDQALIFDYHGKHYRLSVEETVGK